MFDILELVHYGKVSSNGYAEISVNIQIQGDKTIEFNELRGFIDSGAGRTSIREGYIRGKIDLSKYQTSKRNSANGDYESIQIPNVFLNLPLMKNNQWLPLEFIGTVNIIDHYDIVIGCDILHMCEFIYNGISKTYFLKMYQPAIHEK